MCPGLDESDKMDLSVLRDRLLDGLEEAGVPGVISAGVGQSGGKPALVLLVRSIDDAPYPSIFEGVPVITRQIITVTS